MGTKGEDGGLHLIFGGGKTAVPDAVAAFIGVEAGFDRLPAGIPDRVPVLNVKIFSVDIRRHVIVAVAGQTQELCVLYRKSNRRRCWI